MPPRWRSGLLRRRRRARSPTCSTAGVDYLVCEALAELTLAILQKDRQRDERLGYTRDLPLYVRGRAAVSWSTGAPSFITNAGGINPVAAGRAVVDTLKAAGVVGHHRGHGRRRRRAPAGRTSCRCRRTRCSPTCTSAPVRSSRRCEQGADIVVTGRVADASLFLAPLVHEHGWAWDDWDRLAAGVVVGHLLECSGQVAGGNYSGAWWENPDPPRIGFPIGRGGGRRHVPSSRRPPAAGGMVTFDTVREQLLYEVHDPRALPQPRRHRRLHVAHLTTSATTGSWSAAPGAGRRRPPTRASCARRPGGRARRRSPTRGPTPRPRRVPPSRWVRQRAERTGRTGATSGARSTSAPAPSTGRRYDLDRADAEAAGWEPPEVLGRLAWRTADPESAAAVARGVGRARPVRAADDLGLRTGTRSASPRSCSTSPPSPSTGTSSTREVRIEPRGLRDRAPDRGLHGAPSPTEGASAVTVRGYVQRAARPRLRRHRRRPPPPPAAGGPAGYIRWRPAKSQQDIGGVFYNKGLTILLMIVTCGIWGFFWTYRTSEDLKKYNGDGLGGVLGVVIYLLLSARADVHDPERDQEHVRARRPAERRCRAIWGLWFLLPIIGHIIWYLKVQDALNDFWRSKGARSSAVSRRPGSCSCPPPAVRWEAVSAVRAGMKSSPSRSMTQVEPLR